MSGADFFPLYNSPPPALFLKETPPKSPNPNACGKERKLVITLVPRGPVAVNFAIVVFDYHGRKVYQGDAFYRDMAGQLLSRLGRGKCAILPLTTCQKLRIAEQADIRQTEPWAVAWAEAGRFWLDRNFETRKNGPRV